ncbi:MAG: agmatinase [Bacillota bacterium]|nr:agmatinase [Bacillota bacterium]
MLEKSNFKEASWLRWAADKKEDAKICIMGIPFDNAVSLNKGAAKAPDTLRRLSVDLSDTTDEFQIIKDSIIYDAGDLPVELVWEKYFEDVEKSALELLQSGKFCLFLGGDHSVTIPLHKAFGKYYAGKKIGILHFDAHYDLCPEYDGHPWSHACTEARALDDVISGRDLSFIGVRVAEETELQLLKNHPDILTLTAANVYDSGAQQVIDQLVARYEGYDAIYLTLDIDVLDPAFAPGTGTPVSGGLNPIDLHRIFRGLLERLPICAMDIVEVAPPLDVNDITSWAALRVIHELFSHFSK